MLIVRPVLFSHMDPGLHDNAHISVHCITRTICVCGFTLCMPAVTAVPVKYQS